MNELMNDIQYSIKNILELDLLYCHIVLKRSTSNHKFDYDLEQFSLNDRIFG